MSGVPVACKVSRVAANIDFQPGKNNVHSKMATVLGTFHPHDPIHADPWRQFGSYKSPICQLQMRFPFELHNSAISKSNVRCHPGRKAVTAQFSHRETAEGYFRRLQLMRFGRALQ
jgi:hypothetical protein